MTVDNHIFYTCSHFLSVSERKSRISSFSISNLLIYLSLLESSYCNWVNLLNCWIDGGSSAPFFRGLPFGLFDIPADSFLWFLLYLWKNSFICSLLNPNLNISKLWPFNRGYSALIKSSKSLENKGFIAMCSPYLFIRLHTSLLFPSLLIRANARARKSHNKI